jgi:hypothetical protein
MVGISREHLDLADKVALAELQNISYKPSYPLDRFLWLESKPLDELVNQLASEITTVRIGRKRPVDAEEKLHFFIKLLLLNLLMLHKLPRKTLLAMPKGAGAYTTKDRYNQPLLSYATMKEAYDRMIELGYILETDKGFWDKDKKKGKVTRIDATPQLLERFDTLFPQQVVFFTRYPNEETITQKDNKKREIEYKDTPYSNAARENLKVINACLSRHWYDLELSNHQFDELSAAMLSKHEQDEKKPPVINFTARSLYRVFNDGNTNRQKDNFKLGGRFYGGWWEGIPSKYRRYITINQKHTVELDYSNLHPHMLYAMQGIKLDGDAYTVDGIPRNLCKLAFSKLLNGSTNLPAPDDYNETVIGLSWKRVLEAVEARHEPIRKHFRTGYGLYLQWLDAEILEQILLHFAKRDIPCLPIHDSIIIHHDLSDELKDVMLVEYNKRLGQEITLKNDDNYQFFVEHYKEQGEDTTPIETILKDMQGSQYESRWMSWCSQRDNNTVVL